MKLEREPVFGHLTINHKPDSDHNEITLDSAGLPSTNGIMESQNRVSCDSRDSEEDAGQVPHVKSDVNSFGDTGFDCSESVDDIENSNEYEANHSVSGYTLSSEKLEALEKESDYYMDKSVTECELPEFLICYKEGSCHAIKDICIDEGVASQDKIWVETGGDEKACYLCPDEYQKRQLPDEKVDIAMSVTDCFKSSAEYEDKDFSISADFKDLMQRGDRIDSASKKSAIDVSEDMISPASGERNIHSEDSNEATSINVSEDVLSPVSVRTMQQLGARSIHSEEDSTEAAAINVSEDMFSPGNKQQLGVGNVHSEASNEVGNKALEETVQISSEKGSESPYLVSESKESEKQALISAAEDSSCPKNELSDNSKVENGSISFGFDSSIPESVTTDGSLNDVHEDFETQVMPVVDVDGDDCHMPDSKIVPDQVQLGLTALITGREEFPENAVCQSPRTSNASQVDDDISDSKIVSNQLQIIPLTIAREEFPANGTSQGPETSYKYMDDYSDMQNNPFLFHRGLGESSFSGAGHFASLLHTSGPYSGNVSLRSESSTTSTRSFAFPVLQCEWNSSPVRMANADRRHLRKHRGWRHSLLCCRF